MQIYTRQPRHAHTHPHADTHALTNTPLHRHSHTLHPVRFGAVMSTFDCSECLVLINSRRPSDSTAKFMDVYSGVIRDGEEGGGGAVGGGARRRSASKKDEEGQI